MPTFGPTVTVDMETERFQAASRDFLSRLPSAFLDVAVRKMAFDVLADIVRGLNGIGGYPKRIDTGRYRGGWRQVSEQLGQPISVNGPDFGRSGDGSHAIQKTADTMTIVASNNVEYGSYVEDGTARMRAGNHVKRALALARDEVPQDPAILDAMQKAWSGG